MPCFSWISTVLPCFALAATLTIGTLKQQFVPPILRDEPKLPLTEQEQSRIAAEIEQLHHNTDEDGPNPWELSGLFEGDILLDRDTRNAIKNDRMQWPNAIVPFYIKEDEFTDEEKTTILKAIEEYHNRTCIKFRPYRTNDTNWLVFRSYTIGCWSGHGVRPNGQTVNLQAPNCVRHGVIIHELLHTLGFRHQQSAPDRDDYVRILWENVKNGTEHNFKKYSEEDLTSYGVEYDYDSVMHYHPKAFSKNGQPTIEPLQPNATIGQRIGLSEKDVTKLERMYEKHCAQQEDLDYAELFDQSKDQLTTLKGNVTV